MCPAPHVWLGIQLKARGWLRKNEQFPPRKPCSVEHQVALPPFSLSLFFFLTWDGLQYLCATWNLGLGFDTYSGTSSHPSGPQDVPSPAAPVSCGNLSEMWHCGTPPLWPSESEIGEGAQQTHLQAPWMILMLKFETHCTEVLEQVPSAVKTVTIRQSHRNLYFIH